MKIVDADTKSWAILNIDIFDCRFYDFNYYFKSIFLFKQAREKIEQHILYTHIIS